jgi:hypothetical protein
MLLFTRQRSKLLSHARITLRADSNNKRGRSNSRTAEVSRHHAVEANLSHNLANSRTEASNSSNQDSKATVKETEVAEAVAVVGAEALEVAEAAEEAEAAEAEVDMEVVPMADSLLLNARSSSKQLPRRHKPRR